MSRAAVFEASLSYFLQPIASLLEDPAVTEIMVNGHDRVFAERRGRLESVAARFDDEDALLSAIHNLTQYVGRDISAEQPILDARLPSGARVHAIIPPASRVGPCLTIRKFRPDVLSHGRPGAAGQPVGRGPRIRRAVHPAAQEHHRRRRQRRGQNVAARGALCRAFRPTSGFC